MSDDDMYVHRPTGEAVRGHLSRYPRHYGALALFALAMVLVPTVRGGSDTDPSPTGASTAAPSATDSAEATGAPTSTGVGDTDRADPGDVGEVAAPSPAATSGPSSTGVDRVDGTTGARPAPSGGTSTPAPAPAPSDGVDDEGDSSGAGGVGLPPPPAVPLPEVPEELEPVVAAVAPLTTHGCSSIGLVGVVVAVAAPAAGDDVPVAELMPYLAPAYSACATFPAPSGDPTVCAPDEAARDAGYPSDVSGLMKTPNVIGVGIDTLYGLEAAAEAYTGNTLGLVDQIAEQLGCH